MTASSYFCTCYFIILILIIKEMLALDAVTVTTADMSLYPEGILHVTIKNLHLVLEASPNIFIHGTQIDYIKVSKRKQYRTTAN